MKCEYCGSNLSLEQMYCPHCGKENQQAKEHVKNMLHYKRDYENTRNEVIRSVSRERMTSIKIAVIAGLLILAVVMMIVGSNAYSGIYDKRRKEAYLNRTSIKQEVDTMVENGDYMSAEMLLESYRIGGYEDGFQEYTLIVSALRDYADIYHYIMQLYTPGKYSDNGRTVTYLSESMERFYQNYDRQFESYYDDQKSDTPEVLNSIRTDMEKMVTVYLGVDEETVSKFSEMTQTKRAYAIEEAMNREE